MNFAENTLTLLCSAPQGEQAIASAPANMLPVVAAASDPMPSEIVWIPKGTHEISAHLMGGGTFQGKVIGDEAGARAAQASLAANIARGQPAWIDCNHDDKDAAAWVTSFSWDASRGIVAHLEWTPLGEQAVREKRLRSFSPVFLLNRETNQVRGIPYGHAAGALVNAPAFGAAMPALAARLAGSEPSVNPAPDGPSGNTQINTTMNKELMLKVLAALAVTPPADATDAQLAELIAKHADKPAVAKAEMDALKASLAELKAKQANPEQAQAVKALQDELAAIKAAQAAALEKANDEAVQAAVARGAITKDDVPIWAGLVKNSPDALKVLASMKGSKSADEPVLIVPDVALKSTEEGARILKSSLSDTLKGYARERSPAIRARIYADGIAPIFRGDPSVHFGSILATNSLGTLAGDLITQQSLSLLKQQFPFLFAISTDFSGDSVKFGQQIVSRIKTLPTKSSYVAGTGYTTSGAGTTDVPVTIDQHDAVELSFNANELASTDRNLFAEQVEGANYVLGKALVDAVLARITVANFSNETIVASSSFARAGCMTMAEALSARGVPDFNRFLLLNGTYFSKLGQDTAIVSLATFQRPEIITKYTLPEIAGFQPYRAGTLPTAETLCGFGGTADSLVVATRVPNDYTQALAGASNGAVSVVMNPDTGVSVQLVQFVDHKLAASYWRIALTYGSAKGQAASGQRLVSASTTG